jgi:hypothetical protein
MLVDLGSSGSPPVHDPAESLRKLKTAVERFLNTVQSCRKLVIKLQMPSEKHHILIDLERSDFVESRFIKPGRESFVLREALSIPELASTLDAQRPAHKFEAGFDGKRGLDCSDGHFVPDRESNGALRSSANSVKRVGRHADHHIASLWGYHSQK